VNKHELRTLVDSLTAEIVQLQTNAAYHENELQAAVDTQYRLQVTIDQQAAYIDVLLARIVELTALIDSCDEAFETIGNTLRASTQLNIRSN
jgi:hypothetical protein